MPADRPLQHDGDLAAFLRQLGVQEVTGQELAPLITAEILAADASTVGPGFVATEDHYYLQRPAPVAGLHAAAIRRAGPRGTWLLYVVNMNPGAGPAPPMLFGILPDDQVPEPAGAVERIPGVATGDNPGRMRVGTYATAAIPTPTVVIRSSLGLFLPLPWERRDLFFPAGSTAFVAQQQSANQLVAYIGFRDVAR